MFDDSMKVVGKGGVTKNAELSYTNNGTAILSFSLGVSKSRKIKGTEEYEQKSHYFNCKLIGRFAETMVNHLTKGCKVYIVGDLNYSSWEKEGIKHNKLEILVQEIEIIKKADQGQQSEPGNNNYNSSTNQHFVSNNPEDYYQNGTNRHTGIYNKDFDRING